MYFITHLVLVCCQGPRWVCLLSFTESYREYREFSLNSVYSLTRLCRRKFPWNIILLSIFVSEMTCLTCLVQTHNPWRSTWLESDSDVEAFSRLCLLCVFYQLCSRVWLHGAVLSVRRGEILSWILKPTFTPFLLTDSGFVLHDWIHFQVKENLNSLSEHPACFPQKWLFVCFFSYYDTKAVFLALGITAVVCIAVTVFCFQTKVRCVWVCARCVFVLPYVYLQSCSLRRWTSLSARAFSVSLGL